MIRVILVDDHELFRSSVRLRLEQPNRPSDEYARSSPTSS